MQPDSNLFVDFSFLQVALRRFSTPQAAVTALRELGEPPAFSNTPISDSQLEAVASALGALAGVVRGLHGKERALVAVEAVKAKWTSRIEPWVKWSLKHVVLDQKRRLTPPIVDFIDRILLAIPIFLAFPGVSYGRSHTVVLKRQSPDLQPLLTQTWLKTMDTSHRTWGLWCICLVGFASTVIGESVKPSTIGDGPYEENEELGRMLIRHLNIQITPLIPSMSTAELEYANTFLLTLSGVCFVNHTPFDYFELRALSIPASVRLVYTMVCKRKTLRRAHIDSPEMVLSLEIATICTTFLAGSIQGASYVVDAVKAGIIGAIFETNPKLFRCKERNSPLDHRLYFPFMKIINTISRFLVYPAVLHEFLRAAKPIVSSERLESDLKTNSEDLWECWERTKLKAFALKNLRHELRKTGPPSCSNDDCPTNRGGHLLPPRYFRCSGCSYETYCSPECFKMHWRAGHRERCPDDVKGKQEGPSKITAHEWRFFLSMAQSLSCIKLQPHHDHGEPVRFLFEGAVSVCRKRTRRRTTRQRRTQESVSHPRFQWTHDSQAARGSDRGAAYVDRSISGDYASFARRMGRRDA
ncbi:hypothetical protein PM082_012427 [Marasmius tenuissimus]|nr:hypothetical protein PM082_012427 [Marasmius tenuissimus]